MNCNNQSLFMRALMRKILNPKCYITLCSFLLVNYSKLNAASS